MFIRACSKSLYYSRLANAVFNDAACDTQPCPGHALHTGSSIDIVGLSLLDPMQMFQCRSGPDVAECRSFTAEATLVVQSQDLQDEGSLDPDDDLGSDDAKEDHMSNVYHSAHAHMHSIPHVQHQMGQPVPGLLSA